MARLVARGSLLDGSHGATHSVQAGMIPSPSSLIIGTPLHG
jgi:hypothetical protein